MQFSLSDSVTKEVLKLQAIEEGRLGNYTKVDTSVDRYRYHVSDLVMGAVYNQIRKLQGR